MNRQRERDRLYKGRNRSKSRDRQGLKSRPHPRAIPCLNRAPAEVVGAAFRPPAPGGYISCGQAARDRKLYIKRRPCPVMGTNETPEQNRQSDAPRAATYSGPEFGRRYYVGGREVTAVKWREYNLLGAPARQLEYRRLQGSRRILPSYNGCGRAVAATLQDGGGTFEKGTLKAAWAVKGYQVGTAHPLAAGTLLKSSPAGQLAEYVRSYAHAAAPLMKPGDFLGTWVDGDLFYIEISRHVETFGDAAALARRHQQAAVWQWDKSLSLPVAPPFFAPAEGAPPG